MLFTHKTSERPENQGTFQLSQLNRYLCTTQSVHCHGMIFFFISDLRLSSPLILENKWLITSVRIQETRQLPVQCCDHIQSLPVSVCYCDRGQFILTILCRLLNIHSRITTHHVLTRCLWPDVACVAWMTLPRSERPCIFFRWTTSLLVIFPFVDGKTKKLRHTAYLSESSLSLCNLESQLILARP